MSAPSHRIRVDASRKLIEVSISGFLTPEDAGWIGEELREAVRGLGPDVGQHVTLYEVSGVPALPLATIGLLKAAWTHPEVRKLWARKVAYVTTTAIGRLQANLIREARKDIAVFDDRAAALAWLLAD